METEIAAWLKELREHQAIEVLNKQFCHYLDHCMNAELLDLFTEGAHYRHGDRLAQGKSEIAAVFAARVSDSPRTARHVQTGLLIVLSSDSIATGRSCCVTFAADAKPPVIDTQPLLVADFNDVYEKGSDGRWRISERNIERIFVAPGNPGPVGSKLNRNVGVRS